MSETLPSDRQDEQRQVDRIGALEQCAAHLERAREFADQCELKAITSLIETVRLHVMHRLSDEVAGERGQAESLH